MQRLGLALSLVLSVFSSVACSDDAADDGGETTGGSGGSATGGSATGGSATGGSATGGSATGGSATGGSATGGSATGGGAGAATTGGNAGAGGSAGGGFTKTGICGHRSEATVMGNTYSGTEEWYTVSEEAIDDGRLDEYTCLIRFDVTRVGEAPAGCVDLDGMTCLWSAKVEVSNPTIVTNIDGACEGNELHWNMAWMDALDGTQPSYGYVDQYEGHNSVVMKAAGAPGAETWAVYGNASWVMESGEFAFDNRLGECQY